MRAMALGPDVSITQRYVIVAMAVEPNPRPKTQSRAENVGTGGGPETNAAHIEESAAPMSSIIAAATGDGVSGVRLATTVVMA